MKKKQYYFPNNYRFITERNFLVWAFSIVIFVEILFAGMLVNQALSARRALFAKREEIGVKVAQWQGIVKKYPDYRDGYIQLSLLEYQLGNNLLAEQYIDKALAIDPFSKDAQKLKDLLRSHQ